MRKVSWFIGWSLLLAFALADTNASLSNLQAHVRYLASPELEGRLAIAPGSHKAADYIARMFKEYGLEPKGTQGYFQDFEMTIGFQATRETGLELKPRRGRAWRAPAEAIRPINLTANAKASGEIVFVGYGISAPEQGYDEYAGVEVQGKIVALLRGAPDWGEGNPLPRAAISLSQKVRTAAEKGAVGVLVLNTPDNDRLLPLGGRGRMARPVEIPVLNVNLSVANRLLQPARLNVADAVEKIKTTRQPLSQPIPNLQVEVSAGIEPRRGIARNVIGFLPGSDPAKREEMIVIGAHYDHLGFGEVGSLAPESGDIHHGADDNASGTAGLLELARMLSADRAKLPRSVLFIAFSGEEEGLVGSAYFVRNPTVPLEKIIAMINLDMIGRMTNDRLSVSGIGSSPQWEEIVKAANSEGLTLSLSQTATGGSDHTSFFLRNIPVLFFFTGMHPDYHRPSDTWEKINYEGQAKVVQMVYRVTTALAQREERIAFSRPQQPQAEQPMRRGGRVRLGIIPDYTVEDGKGVLLQGVSPNSPAEKAGLKAGDRLIAINGKRVQNIEEMMALYAELEPGKPAEVTILRDGQEIKVQLVPIGGE
ncbi:MAG: M20/M25/M40 family metallo-hydrolase [Fimbriimonadales bacterium]|nr:M20/M25/M40 family metallo-hydrolase [Fimbriimonadales bacterium]